MLILLMVLLAACGGHTAGTEGAAGAGEGAGSGNAGQQAGGGTSPSPSPAAKPATRVFKDVQGHEVTIPTAPQRIVVDQFMGHLLALGVKPVGAASYQFGAAFLKEPAAGVADVGNPVSMEKVLELKPDLIILQAGGAAAKSYDTIAKIAPTIVLAYGTDDPKNVLDQLREIGDIVGKSQEAEQWIANYEAKAKLVREQIAKTIGPDKTFSIVEVWAKSTVVFGKNFGRGGFNLYDSLQLSAPPKVKTEMIDKNENWKEISMEVLPEFVGDYIFLSINAGADSQAREQELRSNPVWNSLPAVKNNRVFTVNYEQFFPGDPISVDKQLDLQAQLLTGLDKK